MTERVSMAVWASAAWSRGKVCPMTGWILAGGGFGQCPGGQGLQLVRGELDLFDAADGDAALSRFGWVDQGEAAAGGSVGGEAAAVGGDGECGLAEVGSGAVEHDVRPYARRRREDFLRPAGFGVVGGHLRSELERLVELAAAACGSDDVRAGGAGELHQ